MIQIRIQCGCGQFYEVEIEPVNRRAPLPVACPTCGADGAEAANAALAQSVPVEPAAIPVPGPLRVSLAPRATQTASARPPHRPTGLLPGRSDRTQAKVEARAKISWGDPPREVLAYLMGQGFSHGEASEFLDELVRERTATIRGKGIMNILAGVGLFLVPVVAFFIFMGLGYILVKTFVIMILVGFFGIWLIIKGANMLIAPKTEKGDVADD
jgi:hypothetical protein